MWIGKTLTRKYFDTFVDMIFAGVFDDVLRNFLFISKYSLVVFESCQITVDHLGVIPHTDLVGKKYSLFLFSQEYFCRTYRKSPGSCDPVFYSLVNSILDVFQQRHLLRFEQTLGCTRLKKKQNNKRKMENVLSNLVRP